VSYNPYQPTSGIPSPSMGNGLNKVKVPGILLMISGVVNLLLGVLAGGMMPVVFFGMFFGVRDEIESLRSFR